MRRGKEKTAQEITLEEIKQKHLSLVFMSRVARHMLQIRPVQEARLLSGAVMRPTEDAPADTPGRPVYIRFVDNRYLLESDDEFYDEKFDKLTNPRHFGLSPDSATLIWADPTDRNWLDTGLFEKRHQEVMAPKPAYREKLLEQVEDCAEEAAAQYAATSLTGLTPAKG